MGDPCLGAAAQTGLRPLTPGVTTWSPFFQALTSVCTWDIVIYFTVCLMYGCEHSAFKLECHLITSYFLSLRKKSVKRNIPCVVSKLHFCFSLKPLNLTSLPLMLSIPVYRRLCLFALSPSLTLFIKEKQFCTDPNYILDCSLYVFTISTFGKVSFVLFLTWNGKSIGF